MPALMSLLVVLATSAADDRLVAARAALESLEYERAIEITRAIIGDEQASREQKLEALFMSGYALALTNRVTDATSIFKDIVTNYDVNAEPPFLMEPRVQIILDAVRADELARRARLAEEKRDELRRTVRLTLIEPPRVVDGKEQRLVGGERAVFIVKLDDRSNAVRALSIEFKSRGATEYSSLPMTLVTTGEHAGHYRGVIPGTYTRNRAGLEIFWVIEAKDEQGTLAGIGTTEKPMSLSIAPGMDVARDLRANERLPEGYRYLFAMVLTPILTTGAAWIATLPELVVAQVDERAQRLGQPRVDATIVTATWFTTALLPPLFATSAAFLANQYLLDGSAALIPAAIMGAFSVGYAVCVLAELAVRGVSDDGTPRFYGQRTEAIDARYDFAQLAGISALTGVIVATSAAVVLVALDPQGE